MEAQLSAVLAPVLRDMIARAIPTILEIQRDGVETPEQVARLAGEMAQVMEGIGMSHETAQTLLGPITQEALEAARRAGRLTVDARERGAAGTHPAPDPHTQQGQEGAGSSAQE